MEQLDLNIENYNLDGILDLFNLNHQFDYKDLRCAIKKLSKLHPDKSGLPTKYFIFFKEAYSVLLNIYKFREKSKQTFREDFYSEDIAKRLCSFIKSDNFNERFNALFEETFERETHGYEDWLKTTIPVYEGNRNTYFSKHHNAIVVKDDNTIKDISHHNSSNLNLEGDIQQNEYACPDNSKLKYDDIKKVYSETFIPVNENDQRIGQFSTIQSIQQHRENQNTHAPTKKEAEYMLKQQHEQEQNHHNHRLFNLLKKDEKIRKKQLELFNKLCM